MKYKNLTRIKFKHFTFLKNEFNVFEKFNMKNLILIFEKKDCFQ